MLFSKRDLAKIVIPLIIQQLLAVTIGAADSVMVAYAGEAAVSGVSLINTLDTLLVMVFTSLVAGGGVVVAQSLGRGDPALARSSSKQLLWTATGIAIALTGVVVLCRVPLLNLLYGDVEPAVMDSALSYFFFMALSFPFLAIESACAALFRTMGNTVISMVVSICMNLLNVGGNALLIMHFEMGAAGAAIASLFARICGAVVLLVLLHSKKRVLYFEKLLHYRPDFKIIKSILRIGVPNGIENGMFQFGKLLTQSLISSMGTAAIAANAVASTLATFQYMPGSAAGSTMVAVVGRCIGAGEREQARRYTRMLTSLTYFCVWFICGLTFLLASPLISLYKLSPESGELSYQMIMLHAICACVIWPMAFTLPHAFRAASDVKYPLVISMLSMWLFRVALSYVFSLQTVNVFGLELQGLALGAIGVWLAMSVDWLFRALLFFLRYLRGKWLQVYDRLNPVA
ncbi:MAG: MATE family efflux transporter [Clostridia bacterium]|nr:MATE family efflux transporter [Clostridia bacterium]